MTVGPGAREVPLHLRLQGAAGRLLLRLPRAALVALSGGRRVERDGCVLDEQLQFLLFLAAHLGRGGTEHDVAKARVSTEVDANVLAPPAASLERVDDERLSDRVAVRIYRPRGLPAPAPALVYLHGGGFVVGSLDSHDRVCRCLADEARCVVIAVDYRLAPEHPFPAAADDATEAFRWVVKESERLDIDPARIAVSGDSAGGNLAAVVALDTREDLRRPCLQALLYPVVDNTRSFPSAKIMATGFLLEETAVLWYRSQNLPNPGDWTHERASPWFAADVSKLPPALVQTAGFDPLRDEAEAYAKRLREAGVAVESRRYPSLVHGFVQVTGAIEAAREPWNDLVAALRRAFELQRA